MWRARPRAPAGFTLLEVLAAVAVLAILYTVLAGTAISGLRAEGTAKRRLDASLLVDRLLAELEIQIQTTGLVPRVGSEEFAAEREGQEFLVTQTVRAYDLPVTSGPEGESQVAALSDLSGDGTSPIRSIQLRVSWPEGLDTREVVRTTFALDLSALSPELVEQAAQAGAPAGSGLGAPESSGGAAPADESGDER